MGGEIKVETGNFSFILIIIVISILSILVYYELRKLKLKINKIEENLIQGKVGDQDEMGGDEVPPPILSQNLENDEEPAHPSPPQEARVDIVKKVEVEPESNHVEMTNEITVDYLNKLMNEGVEIDEKLEEDISEKKREDELKPSEELDSGSDSKSEPDSYSGTESEPNSESDRNNNDYDLMSVAKLKEILKELNLPMSGNKTKLIQRIKDNEINTEIDPNKDIKNLILKI